MIADPSMPLEERLSSLLALLEQFISLRLHLDQLVLILVSHDLRYERHLEELVVGILTHTSARSITLTVAGADALTPALSFLATIDAIERLLAHAAGLHRVKHLVLCMVVPLSDHASALSPHHVINVSRELLHHIC